MDTTHTQQVDIKAHLGGAPGRKWNVTIIDNAFLSWVAGAVIPGVDRRLVLLI